VTVCNKRQTLLIILHMPPNLGLGGFDYQFSNRIAVLGVDTNIQGALQNTG
jgi:hypothetical protein